MNTEAEQQLLHNARNGYSEEVRQLLETVDKGEVTFNINCKGRSKSNLGWTPLHLACYFGHTNVVKDLLKAGAEVNVLNDIGDTPLHRASFTGRKEVVMLLLEHDADTSIVNGNGQTAKDVTHDKEIKEMLEAVEKTQERKLEELLLGAAREGETGKLSALLNRPKPPDINCADQMGNTPLHCAAYRAHRHCALKLLKCGADPKIKNKNGQTPFALAQGVEMKQMLGRGIGKVINKPLKRYEGQLWKSSRFFGWKPYWVVLEHGVLSWYQKQTDTGNSNRRQGCKHLTQAICTIKSADGCLFSIKCFDNTIHSFKVPKTNQQLRENWVQAIEDHSAYSTHYCTQEQLSDDEEEDDTVSIVDLQDSLKNAQTCQQRLDREISSFLSMIKSHDTTQVPTSFLRRVEMVSETSRETCESLNNCLKLFTKQEGVRNLKLEHEQEKTKILSEALETLATEHHELEQSLVKGSPPLSILSEEQFYDAVSDSESEKSLSGFETVTTYSLEDSVDSSDTITSDMSEEKVYKSGETLSNGIKKHRTSLPSPMFSRNDFSIWSILRKCIGMELSKITMPVIFNEPLSFLQRLTEYMEHTYLIHKASSLSDPVERMQCIAAFAVSAVASQWERTGKPFNPLLGETYELVRDDLGFRLISEQVSHHPPISAFYAEGLNNDFVFHGSIYPKLKFWGKSVEAEPKGIITLKLLETGEKCLLNFKPCGLFGKELHKVEGYIQDKSKKKLCSLYGKWTECLYNVDITTFEAYKKNDKKNTEEKKNNKQMGSSDEPDEMPLPDSESVCVIPGSVLLWRIAPRPSNSTQMYNFTTFAMALNELDQEMETVIPKTDCRLRPDIRAMENGDIDVASEEKKRLEEKQRAARKNRSKSEEDWKTSQPVAQTPRWFHQGPNPYIGGHDWIYSGNYWDRNYFNLPDIY
ncbi:oxysterol-binding protein-related protein 1 isoform X3 [Hemicordylus capensis]|uniref:oxysterol-binding protein-related protein 1 isoform X3 n=1 Tax=Hemicordylus capensis TaxID=884348 RepID=UPI0023027DB5|nr:oxysterol-binding protein-related protein 1 isoform X3 [Hemicordylus capensis]